MSEPDRPLETRLVAGLAKYSSHRAGGHHQVVLSNLFDAAGKLKGLKEGKPAERHQYTPGLMLMGNQCWSFEHQCQMTPWL